MIHAYTIYSSHIYNIRCIYMIHAYTIYNPHIYNIVHVYMIHAYTVHIQYMYKTFCLWIDLLKEKVGQQ